jgi:epoxyqueuosine reductase
MNQVTNAVATRELIDESLRLFLANPRLNSLGPGCDSPAWDPALVGVSSAADELYKQLKNAVGPSHWTPAEAFTIGRPSGDAPANEDLSVVSWALPQTKATRDSNQRRRTFPSEEWVRARIFGQACNKLLHERLIEALAARGIAAVAPGLLSSWREEVRDGVPVASSWSERHVAYISGLGTFGLCDGLITTAGKAVRLGSLVVGARLEPTPRPYGGLHDYCLFFSRGTCGRCAARCPTGSVALEGRDKAKCVEHLQGRTRAFVKRAYGLDGYGCGLCQTRVPCESRVPGTARNRQAK